MTPMEKLRDLEAELLSAQDRNKLTPEGVKVLQSLQSGKSGGSVGAFLQGLSLNLSDEAIGAIRSFVSPVPGEVGAIVGTEPRETGIALERMALERYKEESPGKAMAAEIGGAVVPGLFMPGMSLGRAMLAGAGTGVISGAGQADRPIGLHPVRLRAL